MIKIFASTLILSALTISAKAQTSAYYIPIRNNDITSLQRLIQTKGTKLSDSDGNSPLMYAAGVGNAASMKLLLDAGADPNVANRVGSTPLILSTGDIAKVRLLLAKGANVNVKTKAGRTPLMTAVYYDNNEAVVQLLIDKGADILARDKFGASVLEIAAGGKSNAGVAKLLLEKGADVNTKDIGGFTPLLVAAGVGNGNGEMVKLLIEHGADVKVKTLKPVDRLKNGFIALGLITALHEAASQGNYEAALALINAGADVNALDVRKFSPLVWAVATDHPNAKLVKLLLDKGASTTLAIEWARRYRNSDILSLLNAPLAATSPTNPMTKVVKNDRPLSKSVVQESISRALACSQKTAANFSKTGGCISCHAQNDNGIAVSSTKGLGVKAYYELEAREAKTTAQMASFGTDDLFQFLDPPAGTDGAVHSLMQIMAAGLPPTLSSDAMLHYVAANQTKEGYWTNTSQVRSPAEDGNFNLTARSIRVLRQYPLAGRKAEFTERIESAVSWLENASPISTEDRIFQILGIAWSGKKVSQARIQELSRLQRKDGGWGQTTELPTDAYATGEALWALHDGGMKVDDPTFQKGINYLLRTQAKDGTWHIVSRSLPFQPYFESGFPYGHDQWISQAGTAMSVIALSFAGK